jgi:transcriptional regulator with XRE-family HTH domain
MNNLRLKELRIEQKLTQEQLAKLVNLTQSTIAGYENGTKSPSMESIIIFSELFNVTTDYLLGVSNLRNNNPSPEVNQNFIKQFENKYNKLNDNYKLAVNTIAVTLINSLEDLQSNNIANKKITKISLDKDTVSHKTPILYSDDPEIMKELESYCNELINERKNISSKSTKSKHSS